MTKSHFSIALLHGGGQGSWVWQDTLAALAAQSDSAFGEPLLLDVPGCGTKRARAIDLLAPCDVALELIGDIEKVASSNVVLVGHSLAGNVLPAMAELRPKLFRRLIYVACSIPLPGQTVLQMMGNGMHGSHDLEVGWPVDPRTTPMNDRYELMYCNDMSAPQRRAFLEKLGRDNWPHGFYRNTCFEFSNLDAVPASYVVCLEDRSLPARWQEIFAQRLHANRVVRLDAGHQAMVTRPQALAEILRLEAMAD